MAGLLAILFAFHYTVVIFLVFEAIREYRLDKYTPWAVASLLLWFPALIFV